MFTVSDRGTNSPCLQGGVSVTTTQLGGGEVFWKRPFAITRVLDRYVPARLKTMIEPVGVANTVASRSTGPAWNGAPLDSTSAWPPPIREFSGHADMPWDRKSASLARQVGVALTSNRVPFGKPISEWRSGFSCPLG